jgi:hypothetical protein
MILEPDSEEVCGRHDEDTAKILVAVRARQAVGMRADQHLEDGVSHFKHGILAFHRIPRCVIPGGMA